MIRVILIVGMISGWGGDLVYEYVSEVGFCRKVMEARKDLVMAIAEEGEGERCKASGLMGECDLKLRLHRGEERSEASLFYTGYGGKPVWLAVLLKREYEDEELAMSMYQSLRAVYEGNEYMREMNLMLYTGYRVFRIGFIDESYDKCLYEASIKGKVVNEVVQYEGKVQLWKY